MGETKAELVEEEEEQHEQKSTEYDISLARNIIAKLQQMGENVLIDDFLVGNESDDEWDAERLLDVLISMQVAGIEKHRGIEKRTSRAFTYRTGYADPTTTLHTLATDIAEEEEQVELQRERCKRLKLELELQKPSTQEEIRAFLIAHLNLTEEEDYEHALQRYLD